jgi:hypothetical protein
VWHIDRDAYNERTGLVVRVNAVEFFQPDANSGIVAFRPQQGKLISARIATTSLLRKHDLIS